MVSGEFDAPGGFLVRVGFLMFCVNLGFDFGCCLSGSGIGSFDVFGFCWF